MSTLKVNTLTDTAATKSVPIEDVVNGTARAWVNFNGTGTVAIRAQYNVSSITDNGTGDYTVNFTTALSDANYSAVTAYNMHETIAAYNSSLQVSSATYTTTSLRVRAWYGTGGASADTSILNVAIFR